MKIYITQSQWNDLLAAFADVREEVERVAYLDGIEVGAVGVVTTLTVPDATLNPGNFEVSPEAMSRAAVHLRRHGLVRLAQVHTHPGSWTGHSYYDDERAYSQLPGAVSIVVPNHSKNHPDLSQCGIHVRTRRGWFSSTGDDQLCSFEVLPSLINQRRSLESPQKEMNIWKQFLIVMKAPLAACSARFPRRRKSG